MSRIAPLNPPYAPEIQAAFDAIMPPGVPPLVLFRTLAVNERIYQRFRAGGLLDRGLLTLRQREIVIDRTTALCAAEYEWGVHVAAFAAKAGLDAAQIHSLAHGGPEDACWPDADRDLLRLCDALHRHCDVDDGLWWALRARFAEEAMLELLLLAGFYRTVSYLTNALRLPLEDGSARFPDRAPASGSGR